MQGNQIKYELFQHRNRISRQHRRHRIHPCREKRQKLPDRGAAGGGIYPYAPSAGI